MLGRWLCQPHILKTRGWINHGRTVQIIFWKCVGLKYLVHVLLDFLAQTESSPLTDMNVVSERTFIRLYAIVDQQWNLLSKNGIAYSNKVKVSYKEHDGSSIVSV